MDEDVAIVSQARRQELDAATCYEFCAVLVRKRVGDIIDSYRGSGPGTAPSLLAADAAAWAAEISVVLTPASLIAAAKEQAAREPVLKTTRRRLARLAEKEESQ